MSLPPKFEPDQPDPLMTIEETRKYIRDQLRVHVTRQAIHKWITKGSKKRGKLRARQIGERFYVDKGDINEYLHSY